MIPRIIHQIWSGTDEPLPPLFRAFGDTWIELHPDWKYEFWDNARMFRFIREFYPQFEDVYNRYPYTIQRWDAIRYLILDRIGGVYVDFDYECLECINPLLDGKTCCFALEPAIHAELFNKTKVFNNALMGSVTGHPFMKKVIERVFSESTLRHDPSDKMTCVLNTTGPWMLGDVYNEFEDKSSIYLIPAKYVSPFSKMEAGAIINGEASEALEEKLQEAYAIHYFWGAWR